jgi:hypothetical protein
MSALAVAGRRRRRIGFAVIGIAALAAAIVLPTVSRADNSSGCDFAATGTTQSCSGPLDGSTFAGGDGNLLASPTTFGTTDWQNVGPNAGFDLPSGTSDNSFGQGTKEDNPNVTVVTGSIPPNKSDLTRFYEASDTGTVKSGDLHNFLYLAWERSNVLGTANMDFEINHNTQPDLTTSGAKTLSRTAGDLLVTYDFTNGGGKPTIGLLRWLTSTTVPTVPDVTTNTCLSSNTFPCWGDQKTLDGTDSVAAVNNLDPVTDPLFPTKANYQNPVPALQFGETAIDLNAAGVFATGTCSAFGSAFVRSRSSAAFTAEVKDFIAPIPVTISNCGEVKIIKQTDPRGQNQVFSFTSSNLALPATNLATNPGGVVCPGSPAGTKAGIQPDGSFCLNDAGNTGKTLGSTTAANNSSGNTVDNANVPQGTYTVTEDAEPGSYTFISITCTDNGATGTSESTSGQTATINLSPNGIVTCVYVNQLHLGAILITKSGKDHNCASASTVITNGVCTGAATANLGGAVAKITTNSDGTGEVTGSPKTTSNTSGTACIDGLGWTSRTVTGDLSGTLLHLTSGTFSPTDAGVAVTDSASVIPAGTTIHSVTDSTHAVLSQSAITPASGDTVTIAATSYYVTETTPPTGYSKDTTVYQVDVSQNATCSPATGTAAPVTLTDVPLTDLSVQVSSELAGATNSSISCVVTGTSTAIGNSPKPATGMGDPETVTANAAGSDALKPGSYTCTVVVDP